jgi:hypothetical protein
VSGTTVAAPKWMFPLLWVVLPALGAGLGWTLPTVAHWAAGLPWGPLQLVNRLPEPYVTIGAIVVGVLAGLGLTFAIAVDSLEVTVTTAGVRLRRGDTVIEVDRSTVRHVFAAQKHLVLLGPLGEELAREPHDLSVKRLAAAFTALGYPWRPDGDPYESRYRRWIEDEPDLSASVNALLKVRAKALSDWDTDEVRQLRGELGKLGIVVREDDRKRQFWRRIDEA